MMKLPSFLRTRSAAVVAIGLTLVGGTVVAQTVPQEAIVWDTRALNRLTDSVRRLESRIARLNGEQVVSLTQPDPEFVALQGRVASMDRRLSDVEATLRRVNGDLERVGFQLDESQRDNAALRNRLTDAESRVEELETAAKEAAETTGPIVANSPTGSAAGDLAAAQRMLSSDPARGERALETVIVTWPDAAEARVANYRLGDIFFDREDTASAISAYAAALRGWPTTPWAGEATVKLANALAADAKGDDACRALYEFDARYAASASPALKTRVTEIKTRLGCRR